MTRGVRIRLWVFLVIGGIAIVNAGARYAGLTDAIFPTTYQVSVQLEESGGLFERGEVTYRGFTVGRVTDLVFRTDGVTAELAIKKKWKIPADLVAEVHNRSAVGEQYIDLVPRTDAGPYLVDGSVIDVDATSTPVADQDLIVATDRLLRSIDPEDLGTVVDESAVAFGGAGDDLSRFLGNSRNILGAAREVLPETTALLRSGEVVLGTQNAQARTISGLLDGQLGIRFDVPAGFQIDNKAEAVLATGPGDVAVRFDGIADTARKSLTDYIASGWVTGLQPDTIRPISVNGLEAATARASADRWDFDVTVVRIDNRIYRFLTAVPKGSRALEPTANQLRTSFRKMTPAEAQSLKPLRIRVAVVKPGETIATLAARMMGTDRKLDLFRLINAMQVTSTIKPGDRVKIISE